MNEFDQFECADPLPLMAEFRSNSEIIEKF